MGGGDSSASPNCDMARIRVQVKVRPVAFMRVSQHTIGLPSFHRFHSISLGSVAIHLRVFRIPLGRSKPSEPFSPVTQISVHSAGGHWWLLIDVHMRRCVLFLDWHIVILLNDTSARCNDIHLLSDSRLTALPNSNGKSSSSNGGSIWSSR
jgi:hypothetical protein